jgi:hypothetical protein
MPLRTKNPSIPKPLLCSSTTCLGDSRMSGREPILPMSQDAFQMSLHYLGGFAHRFQQSVCQRFGLQAHPLAFFALAPRQRADDQPTASSVTWPGPNRLTCRVGVEPVGQPTEQNDSSRMCPCDFQLKTLNALGQCHSRFPGKLKGFTRNSTFCVMGVKTFRHHRCYGWRVEFTLGKRPRDKRKARHEWSWCRYRWSCRADREYRWPTT